MAGPDPAVATTRRAVAAAVADLPDGALVLVACSGGPDSTALAAATAFLAAAPHRTGGRRLRAGAVIVDHGWHPGSARVADAAAQRCRALGLDPVTTVAVDCGGSTPPGGREQAARLARYAALDRAADDRGADAVLLGHTRHDQAETVLLGLARGAGARSLAGMRARRGRYRRPFLELDRDLVHAAAAAAGPSWQDPANADPRYLRSRVRAALEVLGEALGPGLVPALARTADQLTEDADCLDDLAAALRVSARAPDQDSRPERLDVAVLAAAPAALRRRVLLAAARDAVRDLAGPTGPTGPAADVGRVHVLAVDALVTAWHGQSGVDLPGRVVARRDCGTLSFGVAVPPGAVVDPSVPGTEAEEFRGRQ